MASSLQRYFVGFFGFLRVSNTSLCVSNTFYSSSRGEQCDVCLHNDWRRSIALPVAITLQLQDLKWVNSCQFRLQTVRKPCVAAGKARRKERKLYNSQRSSDTALVTVCEFASRTNGPKDRQHIHDIQSIVNTTSTSSREYYAARVRSGLEDRQHIHYIHKAPPLPAGNNPPHAHHTNQYHRTTSLDADQEHHAPEQLGFFVIIYATDAPT